MAATFRRTILSKLARNSSLTSKSYNSSSLRKLYVDKDRLLTRLTSEGIPADAAEKCASFITKGVEPSIRTAQYQKYKILMLNASEDFASVSKYVGMFTLAALFADEFLLHRDDETKKKK